jgi:hypothetical protein
MPERLLSSETPLLMQGRLLGVLSLAGIMSAIDVFIEVDKVKGALGEDRVVITLNGKFLPHVEQQAAKNTVRLAK